MPKLLRSLANHLEQLGDVLVIDITFESQPTRGEDDIVSRSITTAKPRRRRFLRAPKL